MAKIFHKLICVLVFLVVVNLTCGERRIINGEPTDGKRYVVYLVKAEDSLQRYDAWLCGGAIVSPMLIVTSAACIEDVQYMYAIAGYKKYVRPENLNTDECTKAMKKKIIYVCLPKAYNFDYPDVQKWAWVDIAVAKVESPYNFQDPVPPSCSYAPNQIPINYEKRYQDPGIDAVVLGWGHTQKWRAVSDPTDMNYPELLGSSVLIQDKATCKAQFGGAYPRLQQLIDKYMICTMTHGNINPSGEIIKKFDPQNLADGCAADGPLRSHGLCDDYDNLYGLGRKNPLQSKGNESIISYFSRRHGFCQNDHGGPMITWVGGHELLIGVASVFRINTTTSDCIGPYLFTSTWCNSAFLHCLVEENQINTRRLGLCDRPAQDQGFQLLERTVSWQDHPDGPAENEVDIKIRPQIPLRDLHNFGRNHEEHKTPLTTKT